MQRIDVPFGGFSVEEEDNVITIHTGRRCRRAIWSSPCRSNTSVQLRSTHGPIVVDGLHGEVDASSTNGRVELMNISGTIVAETTNGSIRASLDRVDPAKPISFSSTNGSIDVTLPADLKANLKMRSFNGSIWSDFEMKLTGGQPVTTQRRLGRQVPGEVRPHHVRHHQRRRRGSQLLDPERPDRDQEEVSPSFTQDAETPRENDALRLCVEIFFRPYLCWYFPSP